MQLNGTKKPNWKDFDNQQDYEQAVIRYNTECMITGIGEPMPITDQSETRPKSMISRIIK